MPNDFDGSAKQYDTKFTYSSIGKAQRKRVYHFLHRNVPEIDNGFKPLDILELNCGTGEDAFYLWKKGHRVIATDVSGKMIDEARKKGKGTSIVFEQLDAREIDSAKFDKTFDLIFSNFGGLNCISPNELEHLMKSSLELLHPSGKMILVIMPKKCLWEQAYFLLKGQFGNAFRRKSKTPISSHVDGEMVPTWYYGPKELISMASNNFRVISHRPIGICIPPSYLEPFFKHKSILLHFLIGLERLFYFRYWSGFADHFIIALEKR